MLSVLLSLSGSVINDNCRFIYMTYNGYALNCSSSVYAVNSYFLNTYSYEKDGGAFTLLAQDKDAYISSCIFRNCSDLISGAILSQSPTFIADCFGSCCFTPHNDSITWEKNPCRGHFIGIQYVLKEFSFIRTTVLQCSPIHISGSDDVLSFYHNQNGTIQHINLSNSLSTSGSGSTSYGSLFQIQNGKTGNDYLPPNEFFDCKLLVFHNNSSDNLNEFYLNNAVKSFKIHCYIVTDCAFKSSIIKMSGGNAYFSNCLFYNLSNKPNSFTGSSKIIYTNCYASKGLDCMKSVCTTISNTKTPIPLIQSCYATNTFTYEYSNPYEKTTLLYFILGSFYLPF